MTCEDAVDLIVDSLMDSLDEEQRERLTAHVRSCESCAAEAGAMGWTWEALSRLEGPVAPERPGADFARRVATSPGNRPRRPWLQAAAAIGLLVLGGAGGFWMRATQSSGSQTAGSTFLFLVRGDQPDATVPRETLIQEYGAWAAALADDGRLVGGDKLTDDAGQWVSGIPEETRTRSDVSGYFLITATDYQQAVEIARASPHVRYGGTFEIRQIDTMN